MREAWTRVLRRAVADVDRDRRKDMGEGEAEMMREESAISAGKDAPPRE